MMQLLMEEESGHTKEPYVQILLEEPDFQSDGTRVVYDVLHWALLHGTYTVLLIALIMASLILSFKCTILKGNYLRFHLDPR